MQKPPDLLERLVDFDRCGNTATERFTLRMEARDEIKRLRGLLAYGTDTSAYRRIEKERDAARRAVEQIAALRKHEIMSWQYRLTEAISIAEKALGLR